MRHFVFPLSIIAIASVAFTLNPTSLGRAADTNAADAKASDAKMPKDSCVKECYTCATSCFNCMKYCTDKGHKAHANMMDVCHHACFMCGHAVEGKMPFAWAACELCEKICNECAATSDKGDAEMKKAGEECRKCAKACAEARK
ncbi:MAG TPA: hypothetical protein VGL71_12235 [Urbifossiella sp.]